MIAAGVLCLFLSGPWALAQENSSLDMQIFETMRRGQWTLAKELLQKRAATQTPAAWIWMVDGDLCFWEGQLERAIERYRRAMQETVDASVISACREKIAVTNLEIEYRDRVDSRSRFSLWMGMGTILALLTSPFLALRYFKRRRGESA